MSESQAPSLNEIKENRERLGKLVLETPVLHSDHLAMRNMVDPDTALYFKLELMQYAGSFKPRGALTVMRGLSKDQLARGVTAISAGNHAIAVAYAADVMGTHAKVVMPKTANPARIARCKSMGAEVVMSENVHQAFERVREIEKDEGRFFVHPFEGPEVALGTATVGLEMTQQCPELDAVIVPVGGGGLCAGISCAIKQTWPNCKVYGVEPVGADTMIRSMASGKCESIDKVRTIADSLGSPYAAPYSLGLCCQYVDEVVLVDDDALCRAMALLFYELKLAVEPAGAAATAAICGPLRERLAGKKVGLVVCGANIDHLSFNVYVERGESLLSH